MALDYRIIGFGFPAVKGGEQVLIGVVDFGMTVTRAEVALRGFTSRFNDDDHHFGVHKIMTSIDRIVGSRVYVKVTFLLRDSSGNIDDRYSGGVHVLVLADVTPRIAPPMFISRAKRRPRTRANARKARAKS